MSGEGLVLAGPGPTAGRCGTMCGVAFKLCTVQSRFIDVLKPLLASVDSFIDSHNFLMFH